MPVKTRGQKRMEARFHLLMHVRQMVFVGHTDPYLTITEPTFVARFLLNLNTDTEESVANVDAFVDLPDGSSWALTIFTVDEVRRLLASWKESGEETNGSYFWPLTS